MKVLIVDDDPQIVEVLRLCLELFWPGVECKSSGLGTQAVELVGTESPDIVLLDLGLPDIDGIEAIKQIRSFSDVPILVVTVKDDEVSCTKSLGLGADDYIVKPFSHLELVARVKAVLRRSQMTVAVGAEKPLMINELMVDFSANEVKLRGTRIQLTAIEWRLLRELVRNRGKLLTNEVLLRRVWGIDDVDASTYVRKYISRLRQKLGDEPQSPRFIISARGMGYKMLV